MSAKIKYMACTMVSTHSCSADKEINTKPLHNIEQNSWRRQSLARWWRWLCGNATVDNSASLKGGIGQKLT